ncbi:MAG: 30S ribosomal protein S17e [Nitrososphaerota archaeon]|nr:30S ribosomal protein S17e [Candidatus Calditenuaceae archaeon]MDW8073211.1 30S ribosomal protein S17e [Nitrososphaerota archaeon]
MGKIRTRKVKVLAAEIFENYPDRVKPDYQSNKTLVEEVLIGTVSQRLVNQVAGYLTTLVKRRLKESKAQAEAEEPAEEVNA